jgi:hypothetical protein
MGLCRVFSGGGLRGRCAEVTVNAGVLGRGCSFQLCTVGASLTGHDGWLRHLREMKNDCGKQGKVR